MRPRLRRAVPGLLCAAAALIAPDVVLAATPAALVRVDAVTQITRVVAVRTDGLAIAQVGDALRLVDPQGGTYPFADAALRSLAAQGRRPVALALAPVATGGQSCPFRPNDLVVGIPGQGGEPLYALDAQGQVAPWRSSVPDGTVVAATFDQSGRFGDSLLVLVRRTDGAAVEEFDCTGRRTEVAAGIAAAQPALAVLPAGAGGALGGALVVATATGLVTVTPAGRVAPAAVDGWSATVHTAIAGLVAVPPRFVEGRGSVDVPGSTGMLQAHASDLAAAGLRDGDLLAAAGTPPVLLAVHCAEDSCAAGLVARAGVDGGGAQGGLAVVPTQVGGDVVLPRDSEGAGWTTIGVAGAAVVALAAPALVLRRRRRRAAAELERRLLDDDPAQPGHQR